MQYNYFITNFNLCRLQEKSETAKMDYVTPFKAPLLTINDPENLHLCFLLDENVYALNAQNILEVTALPMLNEPQRLPEYIVGILNYNDLFIKVIDIRKIFALPQKKYGLNNKIIILKGDESLIAIIVDEVTDFFTAQPSKIQRVMGENFNNITRTFYKLEDKVVNIIDIYTLEKVIKKAQFKENTTHYTNLFPDDEESVFVLNKRKNEIAQIPAMNLDANIYGKDQYVVFTLDTHTYCIYSLYVKELINMKNYPVTKIPYTPDFVKGIINLKGNFYSVVDLKKLIGFDSPKTDTEQQALSEGKAIVLDSPELKLALYVDEINNIINISKEYIEPKNDMSLDNLFINAEAYIDNTVYNILNLDKLINDERLYIDISN